MMALLKNTWRLSTMNDTQQTQPTDTEMLDWMISKMANLNGIHGYFWISHQGFVSERAPTPRQTIAAEMMKYVTK